MSVYIKINESGRMPLLDLWRLIFKFTFDKKACAYSAKMTIETEICKWNGFLRIQKSIHADKYGIDPNFVAVGKKGTVLDEIEYQVGYMCSWIVREEKGDMQHLVDSYKRAHIDYRLAEPMCKVFPECKKLRNYAKGRFALKKNMEDNPDIYKGLNLDQMEGTQ